MEFAWNRNLVGFGGQFELLDHVAAQHGTPSGTVQLFVYCHSLLH
jgi:hypothetical protein